MILKCLRLLAVAAGLASGTAAKADLITVPIDPATTGGFQSPAPFHGDFLFQGVGGARTQISYDSGLFAGPVRIEAISFRPFGTFTDVFLGNSLSVSDSLITLSTTARGDEAGPPLGAAFAGNVGPDAAVVYRGPLTIATQFTPVPGAGLAFDYTITLQTPFVYDPARGNLLLDVTTPLTAATTGSGLLGFVTFDTVNAMNDGVFSVVNPSNGAAGAGTPNTAAPVTQFRVTALPAPAPGGVLVAAVALGTVALGRVVRRPGRG